MKRQTRLHILAAAVFATAPLGVAQAEESNFISEAQTGYFQRQAAMPKTNADALLTQNMRVQRNVLGWEFITYDQPRLGAYGPIRGDMNPQATLARDSQERIWDHMYPIGGADTP